MFYDQTAIDYLIDRIGWAEAIPPTTIAVSVENTTSTSGRFFDEFFNLSKVENVFYAIDNAKIDNDTLNDELFRMKKAAVLMALDNIFDSNPRAHYKECRGSLVDISSKDYSAIIPLKGRLFDSAIGYSMAIIVIDKLLTSIRANRTQRENKFDYQTLKAELEGIKDEFHNVVSVGLYGRLKSEIKSIIKIIFPDYSQATLRGVSVW